jgi:hypothetical protein
MFAQKNTRNIKPGIEKILGLWVSFSHLCLRASLRRLQFIIKLKQKNTRPLFIFVGVPAGPLAGA